MKLNQELDLIAATLDQRGDSDLAEYIDKFAATLKVAGTGLEFRGYRDPPKVVNDLARRVNSDPKDDELHQQFADLEEPPVKGYKHHISNFGYYGKAFGFLTLNPEAQRFINRYAGDAGIGSVDPKAVTKTQAKRIFLPWLENLSPIAHRRPHEGGGKDDFSKPKALAISHLKDLLKRPQVKAISLLWT
jgi:hypothetical protein